MPITPTYPGVYIEELPSSNHAVIPAPTSVTVFVGYTNPFWELAPGVSPPFNTAVELFSFADYQANFGGFFFSPWLPDYVGQAVFQFFANGGSNAYVVALEAEKYFDPTKTPPNNTKPAGTATAPLVKSGNGFTFKALQPVALSPSEGPMMSLTLSNLTTGVAPSDPTPKAGDTADLTIVYGSTVETYRRVPIGKLIETVNARSTLAYVEVKGTQPESYETFESLTFPINFTYATAQLPGERFSMIDPGAFAPVFEENASLDKVPIFNLMALPGISDPTALAQALTYCEHKRAFFIMDPPENAVADNLAGNLPGAPANNAPIGAIWESKAANSPVTPPPPLSTNGAVYFPYLQTTDPVTNLPSTSPPSGFVAGIFANEDNNRGVWKSPAGLETTIRGTTGVVPWGAMNDPQQGVLNELGINCIRAFPGIGSVVFGARTLFSHNVSYEQWKYVAVRRMALFLEQSLYSSLRWAIFEPNDTPLWNALTQEVQAFMLGLYRQGAFQGSTTEQAFHVQCDSTTTSQADIDTGIVNIVVSFAPLKPAEFVVVQIAQLAGQTQS